MVHAEMATMEVKVGVMEATVLLEEVQAGMAKMEAKVDGMEEKVLLEEELVEAAGTAAEESKAAEEPAASTF